MPNTSEAFSIATESLKAAGAEAGDACASQDAIEQTSQAMNQYNHSILNDDPDGAADALKKGNLFTTGVSSIKSKLVKQELKAEAWRNALPSIDRDNFFSFHEGKDFDIDETGVDSSRQAIQDFDKFKTTPEYQNYLGSTAAIKKMNYAAKIDGFDKLFDNETKFGDYVPLKKFDQFEDDTTKEAARSYNSALKIRDLNTLADKMANSKAPAEYLKRYVAEQGFLKQNVDPNFSRIYIKMLDKLPKKGANLSDEMKANIFTEMLGGNSGDSTASQVEGIFHNEMVGKRRELLGKFGYLTKTIPNYFPTLHSNTKIAAAGFRDWFQDALHLFDTDAMGLETEAQKRQVLKDIYNGFEARDKGMDITDLRDRSDLTSTFGKKKKIVFKDGQSAYEYHKKYGITDNPVEIINKYINDSTNEVANVQLFGESSGFTNLNKAFNDALGRQREINDLATTFDSKTTDGDLVEALQNKGLINSKDVDALRVQGYTDDQILKNQIEVGRFPESFVAEAKSDIKTYDPKTDPRILTRNQKAELDDLNTYLQGALNRGGENQSIAGEVATGALQVSTAVSHLGASVWALMADRISTLMVHTRLGKGIFEGIADSLSFKNFSKEDIEALGGMFEHQRAILQSDTEAGRYTALRNKFQANIMKASGVDIISRQAKTAQRFIFLHEFTKLADKPYVELPKEIQELFSESNWETFRKTEGGVDNIKGTPLLNPQKIMYGEGFSDKEITAATEVNGAVNNLVAAAIQEGDLLSGFQYARAVAKTDNPFLRLVNKGIFNSASIPLSFGRRVYPMISYMVGQGKYGAVSSLMLYGLFVAGAQKIVKGLLEGKTPTKKLFEDPNFYMESMINSGLTMGWTAQTLYEMHNADTFGDAAGRLIGGGGLKTGYDASKLISSAFTGNSKEFRRESKTLLNNDFSIKHLPVAGLITQRILYDNIAAALDPDAAEARQRKIANTKKEGNNFYWAPN